MGHIFGPVPSRRLGRSLGIDLVPFKTCTYDCIYCQLGRTTNLTLERREWVPLDSIIAEFKEMLATRPDFITLSGSGEPTLYSRLDELIDAIRRLTDIPVAVLTNGSLLWQPEVRRQLRDANLVIPSLDAGRPGVFQAVNRPHPEIAFADMLAGLVAFRNEFYGSFWLEVLLLGGYTSTLAEVREISRCVGLISPDKVQLNTVTRPPAEDYARAVDHHRLEELATWFDPAAEIIADFHVLHAEPHFAATHKSVLQMIQRRPCTLEDIVNGLGLHRHEAIKYVEKLVNAGQIERISSAGKDYFTIRTGLERS